MSSSTVSLATINAKIDALLGEVALLRAAAATAVSVAPSTPAKTAAKDAPKQPRKKRDGPPSPWIIFTNRVRELPESHSAMQRDFNAKVT